MVFYNFYTSLKLYFVLYFNEVKLIFMNEKFVIKYFLYIYNKKIVKTAKMCLLVTSHQV